MTGKRRIWMALALLSGAAMLGGCSTLGSQVGVKPWQRELLSREDMQLDADPVDAAIDEHMYFSKEASSGGRGFGGGGCGCN
jgi:hypothetical protein